MGYSKSSIANDHLVLHMCTNNFYFPQAKTNMDKITGELGREKDKMQPMNLGERSRDSGNDVNLYKALEEGLDAHSAALGARSRDCKLELYLRPALAKCTNWIATTRNRIMRGKSIKFLKDEKAWLDGGTAITLWTTAVAMASYLQRNILYKRTHMDYYILQNTNTNELVHLSADYLSQMELLLGNQQTATALMSSDTNNLNILATTTTKKHLKEALFRQGLVLEKLPIYRQGMGYEVREGYRLTASTLRFSPSYWVMPAIKVASDTNRPLDQAGLAAPREILGSKYGERIELDVSDHENRAVAMKRATDKIVDEFSNKTTHKCGRIMELTNALTLLVQALQIVTDGEAEWSMDFHKVSDYTNHATAVTSVSTKVQDKWINMPGQLAYPEPYIIRYFRDRAAVHKNNNAGAKAAFYERAAISRDQNSPELLYCICKTENESLKATVCKRPMTMKTAIDKHVKQCEVLNQNIQPRMAQKRPAINSQSHPLGPPMKKTTSGRHGVFSGPGGGRPQPSTASGHSVIYAHPGMIDHAQRPVYGNRTTPVRQRPNRPPPRFHRDQLHHNDSNGHFYDTTQTYHSTPPYNAPPRFQRNNPHYNNDN